MLIVYGEFDEIEEKYLEPFKAQIENYESSLKHTEISAERKKIENEFIETTGNTIVDAAINTRTELLTLRAYQINKEHEKEIAKYKRMIKKAKSLEKVSRFFQSRTLLELTIKAYKEVRHNRDLLNQKIDLDWKQHEESAQKLFGGLQSSLAKMTDEVAIMEKMYKSQESNRQTNEELESVLGQKVLGDAVQDKNGIGNMFQRLLGEYSKEKGENR